MKAHEVYNSNVCVSARPTDTDRSIVLREGIDGDTEFTEYLKQSNRGGTYAVVRKYQTDGMSSTFIVASLELSENGTFIRTDYPVWIYI